MPKSVRIAHVSDLHLGVPQAKEVWRSLRTYLADEIKPDLVAVTGDVIDTPDRTAFEDAKAELDALGITYRICPGNHDRHPLGNAPGAFARVVEIFSSASGAPAWLDKAFGATVARPEEAPPFSLGPRENLWRVRVAGFDTSEAARYSAQGFAGLASLDLLTGTLNEASDCDLVIVLLHHHLLPIPELEAARQLLRNLLAPTIMLNAGTMLERLARGNVNLVLHGHEHHRAVARYGTLAGGNDVVILAAGSATGTKTGQGADQLRASLNLLELRDDRTVWVREIAHRGTGWQIDDRPAIQLLDSRQIDRARFHRRVRTAAPPTSRVVKCVEFHHNRDISLTETRTNWVIEQGCWQITTENSSGWLSPAQVAFDWAPSGRSEFDRLDPLLDRFADHTYRYEARLPDQRLALARRITAAFQWFGGGILTEEDLALLDPAKRGPFRSEGREYAAIRVDNDLEMLSLLVRIPPEFAPADDSIEVAVIPQRASAADRQKDAMLARALQHHAPGMISLEVHYPQKAHDYVISWKPRGGAGPGRGMTVFRERARTSPVAATLLQAFRDTLVRRGPALEDATVALYVPGDAEGVTLLRAADHVPQGWRDGRAPAQLSLRAGHALYRHVWWGSPKVALRERDNDDAFAPDEQALAVVPISPFGRSGEVPWGLVRIGVPRHGSGSKHEVLEILSLDVLYEGMLALLQSAARMD